MKALAHRQRNRHTCRHTYEYGGARGLRNNSPAGRPKRASEIWEAAVRKETAPRDDTENQTTKSSTPVRRRGATARGSKPSVRRIHRTTVANGEFKRRRGGTEGTGRRSRSTRARRRASAIRGSKRRARRRCLTRATTRSEGDDKTGCEAVTNSGKMSNSCAKIAEHQRREAASRASEDVTAPKSSTTNSGDEASETLDDEVIGASVRAGISCAEQRARRSGPLPHQSHQ